MSETKEPRSVGLSVVVDPERPTVDIVFVHGFTGHPVRTWTHPGKGKSGEDNERHDKFRRILSSTSSSREGRLAARNTVYWPREILPETISDARILTYGYETNLRHSHASITSSRTTLGNLASEFLVTLEAKRRGATSRPLVFIAHNLGGVMVKEALRQAEGYATYTRHENIYKIFTSTFGIVFFGTPHRIPPGTFDEEKEKLGDVLWELLRYSTEKCIRAVGLSVNDAIIDSLLPSPKNLIKLHDGFSKMAGEQKWTLHSFLEGQSTNALMGEKVVEDMHARLGNPAIEISQFIDHNHMEMCRFSGEDDIEYQKVAAALERILERIPGTSLSGAGKTLEPKQRRAYLESLRFGQINARHATIRSAHSETCKWLLDKPEYKDWLDPEKALDHHGLLWIKGHPATGKSTIMKFALANLQAHRAHDHLFIISFFFNARGEDLEKSVIGCYRSLLFQLLTQATDLQELLDKINTENMADMDEILEIDWNVERLKHLLQRAILKIGRRGVICFVDALDECEEDDVREMVYFFESLGRKAFARSRFRFCFSSRHYPHITFDRGIQLILEGEEGHRQDIANYVNSELRTGHSPAARQIKGDILDRAHGIFLWVVLVVQMLNKEYDRGRIHALRKRLNEIPSGLDDLFENILMRDGENIEELILCFQWILYSTQPLKREELYYAILAGIDPEDLSQWDLQEVTPSDMDRFVLSSSKGLAEVTRSIDPRVQFIHESVPDYLRKGNTLQRLQSHFGNKTLGPCHQRLAKCCQEYITFSASELLPLEIAQSTAETGRPIPTRFPFLEYSLQNVFCHANTSKGYGTCQLLFLQEFPLESWLELYNLLDWYFQFRYERDASFLYIFASRNFSNLIQAELIRNPDIKFGTPIYSVALQAALSQGYEESARVFLIQNRNNREYGWQQHQKFQDGLQILLRNSTAIARKSEHLLLWAAENRYVPVVELLLARDDIPINARDEYKRTALWWAASKGYGEIVKMLLVHDDIEADARNHCGRTPLLSAAKEGHVAVVELLIERNDVDIDSQDCDGRTPLWWASKGAHQRVVDLLSPRAQAITVNSIDTPRISRATTPLPGPCLSPGPSMGAVSERIAEANLPKPWSQKVTD